MRVQRRIIKDSSCTRSYLQTATGVSTDLLVLHLTLNFQELWLEQQITDKILSDSCAPANMASLQLAISSSVKYQCSEATTDMMLHRLFLVVPHFRHYQLQTSANAIVFKEWEFIPSRMAAMYWTT